MSATDEGTAGSAVARAGNAVTIDVEDWRQLVRRAITGDVRDPDPAVILETMWVMDALEAAGVRATFFVLGTVARRFPDLVRRIHADGHEIASHGLSHTRVYDQTPDEFAAETRVAKDVLEQLTGEPVGGYRAAEFSITERSDWALDVLVDLGFTYDSSIFPVAGRRYGIASASLRPYWARSGPSGRLVEFPLPVVHRGGRAIPVGGGGYFRLLPYRVTAAAIREINRAGRCAVVYLHPYEFARDTLRIDTSGVSVAGRVRLLRYTAIHNVGRSHVRARFRRLLADTDLVPVRELLI